MAVKKYGKDRWQARWRDPDGRQRAKLFSTRAEATKFLNATLANPTGPLDRNASRLELPDLVTQFFAARRNLSAGTVESYRKALKYATDYFGAIRVARITPAGVDLYLDDLATRLQPSTVHRCYRVLNTLFKWAKMRDLTDSNPCDKVTPPRVPTTEMHLFTVDEIEQIAAAVQPRYRCFILVAAYGGLRFSELVGLRRMDVNGTQLTVAGQLLHLNGKWVRSEPKTVAGRRTITLPTSIADELADHLATFTGPAPEDLVFVTGQGNPIGAGFRGNVWARACASVGLGTRTIKNHRPAYSGTPRFHDLRHTAASLAIAAGAHPRTIQQRLGHSSITVTMDRYGHLMAGVDQQLADDLDRLREE